MTPVKMATAEHFPCVDTKIRLCTVFCVQGGVLCTVYLYSVRGALYSGAAIQNKQNRRDDNIM